MRRRAILATLGSTLLAGCGSRVGGGPNPVENTLTPVAVPSLEREADPADTAVCPVFLEDVAVYVCWDGEGGRGVRLRPESSTHDAGTGGFRFTLWNRGDFVFRTSRDRWTVMGREADGWKVIDRGAARDRLTVGPGEQFAWVLGGADGGEGAASDSDPSRSGHPPKPWHCHRISFRFIMQNCPRPYEGFRRGRMGRDYV